MYKKKEIIIIILIIFFTICLAFMPTIIHNFKNNVEEEITTQKTGNPNTITIFIDGELKEDNLELVVPYGASYGYIISKIEGYLNPYSIVDNDLQKRYYSDSKITIESTDIKIEDNTLIDSSLISINLGSKSELMSLYGIGDKRSDAIIEYREKKKIESWDELKSLIGVSDEVIKAIKEKAVL